MPSNGCDGSVAPEEDRPADDYRKVFALFKHYHRAAVTLTVLGLARAALTAFGPDTVTDAWIDRAHFVLAIAGGCYVATPYTRRFLEILTLVRDRH
ncbi:hypothetical protein AB0H83_08710 [Dactylosporangium sp. NPDC050688]|uniref:hypothetical protein n=1 Tax=Dactylosporangium sp. NPDC050688 TaxID=3157217 RepID=UPI0033D08CBF